MLALLCGFGVVGVSMFINQGRLYYPRILVQDVDEFKANLGRSEQGKMGANIAHDDLNFCSHLRNSDCV